MAIYGMMRESFSEVISDHRPVRWEGASHGKMWSTCECSVQTHAWNIWGTDWSLCGQSVVSEGRMLYEVEEVDNIGPGGPWWSLILSNVQWEAFRGFEQRTWWGLIYCWENNFACPGQCSSVGWSSACELKCHHFNSWSGHTPGLWVWSSIGAHTRGNQLMFLSHIDVSLLSLSPSPSL